MHIKSLNFGYKKELGVQVIKIFNNKKTNNQDIPYINSYAALKDQNSLIYSPDMAAMDNFLKDNSYSDPDKLGMKNIYISVGIII